jgi:hypothetical protein
MSHEDHTAATGDSTMVNPCSCAYHKGLGTTGIPSGINGCGRALNTSSYSHLVVQAWHRTQQRHQRLLRAKQHASAQSLERIRLFNIGARHYLLQATPMVGQLLKHSLNLNTHTPRAKVLFTCPTNQVQVACTQQVARMMVHQEYATQIANGTYGHLLIDKPDNGIQMMYKNFSSLSLLIDGPKKHMKLRQLNKIMSDYSVDVLAGCKTRTDWCFVNKEASRFTNLFGDGPPTRGLFTHNINNPKIKRDQWEGACLTALGCFSSYVSEVGVDSSGLEHWSWLYVGGGGKYTRLITTYHPYNPGKKTQGVTIWDQQLSYFESWGKIRNPRLMFKADLLNLLWRWKAAGNEVLS